MEKKFIVFADVTDEVRFGYITYKQQAFTVENKEKYENIYNPLNIRPGCVWKYFTMNEATSFNINRLELDQFKNIESCLS